MQNLSTILDHWKIKLQSLTLTNINYLHGDLDWRNGVPLATPADHPGPLKDLHLRTLFNVNYDHDDLDWRHGVPVAEPADHPGPLEDQTNHVLRSLQVCSMDSL